MTRAYISAKIKDELRIRTFRDQLWSVTQADKYYRKIDPHITVIPPFTIKEGYEEEVQSIVDGYNISGKPVMVKNLAVYENIIEPYVVLLYVDVDFLSLRANLKERLPQFVKGDLIEPVKPHITLFKTQGWWDGSDMSREYKQRLQSEIARRQSFKDTKVNYIDLELKV